MSARRWRRNSHQRATSGARSRPDVRYDHPDDHPDEAGDRRRQRARSYEESARVGWAGGEVGDRDWDEELGFLTAPGRAGGWLPAQVRIAPRAVCVDGVWAGTLVVTGLPREVAGGWLEPVVSYPAPVALALHVDSVDPTVADRQLRRQLARLESVRQADSARGRLVDPHTTAAAQDAFELSERLARAETRLHRIGLALTVHAESREELSEHLAALRTLAASMLLELRPTTFRALAGWTSTLPIGIDSLGHRRAVDTEAAATCFPFHSPDLPGDPWTQHSTDGANTGPGVLLGHNAASHNLVITDRFATAAHNYNQCVLAASGAGKSFAVKLATLRGLYQGIAATVIDPHDEYAALAATVGGAHIRLGAPGVHVNPLDLPGHTPTSHPATSHPGIGHAGAGRAGVGWRDADLLGRRALFCHTLLGVMLGELSPGESAILDVGIHTAYTRAGISSDPASWTRPAPLLADLAAALADSQDPAGIGLARLMGSFVTGSFSELFRAPTSHPPAEHFTVFSLAALPDQLAGVGTLLALDATWRTITAHHPPTRPRVVVVDEAWLLLAHPAGAGFLLRLAKAARKHWTGLTLVTQDAGDVLSTEIGRAVLGNCASALLLRTATQAAPRVAEAFGLSDGEREWLITAERGTGLLIEATHRVALHLHASEPERAVLETDPRQLATARTDTARTDTARTDAAAHLDDAGDELGPEDGPSLTQARGGGEFADSYRFDPEGPDPL